MKFERIPIPEPEVEIQITMTLKEAKTLRRVMNADVSIPHLTSMDGYHDAVYDLMKSMQKGLYSVNL